MFKAIIRLMAESFSSDATAYAMDKLGWFRDIPPRDPHDWWNKPETPEETKWRAAIKEFEKMPIAQQMAWRDRVMRYRSLASVLGVSSRQRRTRKSPK